MWNWKKMDVRKRWIDENMVNMSRCLKTMKYSKRYVYRVNMSRFLPNQLVEDRS